jgi:hypothetical protein
MGGLQAMAKPEPFGPRNWFHWPPVVSPDWAKAVIVSANIAVRDAKENLIVENFFRVTQKP